MDEVHTERLAELILTEGLLEKPPSEWTLEDWRWFGLVMMKEAEYWRRLAIAGAKRKSKRKVRKRQPPGLFGPVSRELSDAIYEHHGVRLTMKRGAKRKYEREEKLRWVEQVRLKKGAGLNPKTGRRITDVDACDAILREQGKPPGRKRRADATQIANRLPELRKLSGNSVS